MLGATDDMAENLANANSTIVALSDLCAAQQRVIQQLTQPLVKVKPQTFADVFFFKKPEMLKLPLWFKLLLEGVLEDATHEPLSSRPRTRVTVKVSTMLQVGDYVTGLVERLNNLRTELEGLKTERARNASRASVHPGN